MIFAGQVNKVPPSDGNPLPTGGMQAPLHWATNFGLVMALDHYVLKPLVEKEILPESLRGPALLGGLYGTNRLLNTVGFGAKWSWSRLALNMPLFYSMQVAVSKTMDAFGIPAGDLRNEYGSVLIGMMPFYLAQHSPALASAMASSAGGVGLAGEGALVYLSRGSGVIGTLTGGAGVLGGICQALGAGGAVMLGDYVGGLGVDLVSFLKGVSDDADYDIVKLAYDQMLSEDMGEYTVGLFGNLIKGGFAIAGYFSDDAERNLWKCIKMKVDGYVSSSEDFTRNIEEALLFSPFQSVTMPNLQSGNYTPDMEAPKRMLRKISGDDPEGFKNVYKLLKLTKMRNPSAEYFIKVFDNEGNVRSEEEFKSYYKKLISKTMTQYESELRIKASRAGLDFDEIRSGRIPVGGVTKKHVNFVNENVVLISRIVMLEDLKKRFEAEADVINYDKASANALGFDFERIMREKQKTLCPGTDVLVVTTDKASEQELDEYFASAGIESYDFGDGIW